MHDYNPECFCMDCRVDREVARIRAEDEARERSPFHTIRCDGGLWYSKGEGKVRREWVYEICQRAGINVSSLVEGQWHAIKKV